MKNMLNPIGSLSSAMSDEMLRISTNARLFQKVKPVGRDEDNKVIWEKDDKMWATCKFHKTAGLSKKEKEWLNVERD